MTVAAGQKKREERERRKAEEAFPQRSEEKAMQKRQAEGVVAISGYSQTLTV